MAIIDFIKEWFHKRFDPHCIACQEIEEDRYAREHSCSNCERLYELLRIEQKEREKLMERLFDKAPEQEVRAEHEYQPIRKAIPWAIRRQMLEAEDRAKAEILRREAQVAVDKNKSTEQLEKELLSGEEDAS